MSLDPHTPMSTVTPLELPAGRIVRMNHDQLKGKVIQGQYRLNSLIARGGMGSVYLARDITNGALHAVKILRDELVLVPRIRERFLNESRATKRIHHPSVVKTIDVGEMPSGAFYIIMEYIDGAPLRRHIQRQQLTMPRTLTISAAMAEGLAAAHEKGVVHRDLKPENVLIPRGGLTESVAKIVDFGIARITDAPRITTTRHVLGTPQYISPEQAMGGPVDARTDIYSMGVMMYEMISGKLPFKARTPESLLRKHIENKPICLSEVTDGLAPKLVEMVMACLEKSPRYRPSNMEEILSILATV